jgi:hypothetical protein
MPCRAQGRLTVSPRGAEVTDVQQLQLERAPQATSIRRWMSCTESRASGSRTPAGFWSLPRPWRRLPSRKYSQTLGSIAPSRERYDRPPHGQPTVGAERSRKYSARPGAPGQCSANARPDASTRRNVTPGGTFQSGPGSPTRAMMRPQIGAAIAPLSPPATIVFG